MEALIKKALKRSEKKGDIKMVKWQINYERCIHCRRCITACLAGVFQEKDGQVFLNKEMVCIDCLHCAAACPEEAVTFAKENGSNKTVFSHDAFEEESSLSKVKFRSIETHLVNRRSYRNFQSAAVPREEIEYALDIASWAPSAKNEHPARWMVLEGREKLDRIMEHIISYVRETGISPEIDRLYQRGKNIVMGKAETIIIGYADTSATNPCIDTVLGLYSAELVLQSRGIGTCWSGYLIDMCNDVPVIRDMLKIPQGNKVYGVLLVGYTEDEEYVNVPNRLKRAEIEWI